MKGTFALYEGDKLQILVGQEGSYNIAMVAVVVVVLLRKAQVMEMRPRLSLLVAVAVADIIAVAM